MKTLCLSDLHLPSDDVIDLLDFKRLSPFIEGITRLVSEVKTDSVVVTGDTVCPSQVRLLSALFKALIPADVPIIVTLGNHECWGRTFEMTLSKLKEQVINNPNVFYLDLIGGIEIGLVNFVGGMLFFDGSMHTIPDQKITDWRNWQDWRITDVENRYKEINKYYVDMIKSRIRAGISTALCTHHVPHEKLNGHAPSHYNFYTGMKDLVSQLPFDAHYDNYLICGHTHKRVIGEVVPGYQGINVGSDYNLLKYFVADM